MPLSLIHILQRETLGDIRLEGDCAYVAATPAIADYLIDNLHEVGRAKVSLSRYDGELPAAESGRREVVNVPSLPLDAVLAQTLNLSRARAQALIRGGAVQKNWQITDRTDAEIAQGDVLSIRGSGRIRVHSVQGESRKGRLFLEEMCIRDRRRTFAQARSLFAGLAAQDKNVDILSMGMSQDARIALEEGSTLVRLGTSLFGRRAGYDNTGTEGK